MSVRDRASDQSQAAKRNCVMELYVRGDVEASYAHISMLERRDTASCCAKALFLLLTPDW